MKFKKLLIISLILLFVLSIGFGTASAIDSDNSNDNGSIDVNYMSDNSDSINICSEGSYFNDIDSDSSSFNDINSYLVSDDSDSLYYDNNLVNDSSNPDFLDDSNEYKGSYLESDYLEECNPNDDCNLDNSNLERLSKGLRDDANTIYVSIDGNDENDGLTRDTPVYNISHAVSLAGEGYTIYIMSGTYSQNKSIQLSHAFDFIGEDGTVILRTGTANVFTYTSDNRKTVSFRNIVFSSTTSNPSNPVLSMAGGANLVLDNCTITDAIAGKNGIVRYMGDSTGTVTNTRFVGLTGSTSGSSCYLTVLGNAKVKVDSCTFEDISEGAFLNSLVYVNNNLANLALANTVFRNITGNLNAVVNNRGYMQIKNCSFSDISLSGNGPRGIVWSPETINNAVTYINSSVFSNNSVHTEVTVNSSVIQAKSPTFVEYSVFLNNDVDFIINNDNETDIIANYNWWGTNQDPRNCSVDIASESGSSGSSGSGSSGSSGSGSSGGSNEERISLVSDGVTIDSWAIMTADFEDSGLIAEEDYPITININQYMNSLGEIDSSIEHGIDNAEISFDSLIGVFNSSSIIYDGYSHAKAYTKNGTLTVIYRSNEEGSDILNISSGFEEIVYSLEIGRAIEYADVYVSKSGSDDNDGLSNQTAVLTIAKALEVGKNQNSNIRIHINEGSYLENGLELNGSYVLLGDEIEIRRTVYSFIGYGNVVIDGNGEAKSLFSIRNNSASFRNIRFTNVNGPQRGGAINVAIRDSYFYNLTALSDLTVNNCSFDNMNVSFNGAAISYREGSGKISINNTRFSNLRTESSQGGAIFAEEGYWLAKIKVTGCDFRDNYANNAGAMYLRISNVSISNSRFVNNSAQYFPGALQFYNASGLIENCIIANSTAKKDSAAIKIEDGTNDENLIIIKSCIIENNTCTDEAAPAIYVAKGTLNISYSSIVNDFSIATRTYSSTLSGHQQGVAIANNNWWGVNNPFGDNEIGGPYLYSSGGVFNGSNITVDKWVILNAVLNDSSVLKIGNRVNVSMDFNHVNDTSGEISLLTGGKIPRDYVLRLNATGGIVSPTYTRTVNGEANAQFHPQDIDNLGDDFTSCGFDICVDNEVYHVLFEINNYKGVIFVSADGDDNRNGSMDAPVKTLQKAIDLALDEQTGSHEIFVLPGVYEVYNVSVAYTNLLITGSGKDSTVFDGVDFTGGIFSIFEGELTVKNLTIRNGVNTVQSGGAFTNMGNLTLDGVNVTNCRVRNCNGAVIYSVGNLNLINSSFVENQALSGNYASGGVIYADGYSTSLSYPPSLNITDCEFISNYAASSSFGGGVIYAQYLDGYKSIRNSRFIDNRAEFGGAIFIQDSEGDFIIDNASFIGNRATGQSSSSNPYYGGGALNLIGVTDRSVGNVTITNSLFINNSAAYSRGGGAILDRNVNLNISNSVFLNNTDRNKSVQVYKDTTVYYPNGGKVVLEDNWWGVNDLGSLSTNASNAKINRWAVMNLTAEVVADALGNDVNSYIVTVSLNEYSDGVAILDDSSLLNHYGASSESIYPFERIYVLESDNGQFNSSEITGNKITGTLENNRASAVLSSDTRNNTIVATIDGQSLEINTLDLYRETALQLEFEPSIRSNENLSVTINLTDVDGNPINGTVELNISSEGFNLSEMVNVTEGQGFKEINGLKIGEYTVLASFDGESIYLPSSKQKELNVSPVSSHLELDSDNVSAFIGFGILTGTLTDDDGPLSDRNVSLAIDDDTVLSALTNESGNFAIDLGSLKAGNYTDLAVSFAGDDSSLGSSMTVNISIEKIVLSLNLSVDGEAILVQLDCDKFDLDELDLEGLEVLALISEHDSLDDSNGGADSLDSNNLVDSLDFNLDNAINKSAAIDKNGTASIDYSDLEPGNYIALISLLDNDNFVLDSNKTIAFNKTKADASATELEAVLDEDFKSILLNLTCDGVGIGNMTISVVLNNESFEVKTNESGLYAIDISGLEPGNYSYKFEFAGDDLYSSSSYELNFTVDEELDDLLESDLSAVLDEENRIILLNLTCDGVGIGNRTISVVLDNESFDVVTNESGLYAIDIGSLVPGDYSYQFIFDGDDSYNASSDELNFTVDKYDTEISAKNLIANYGMAELSCLLSGNGIELENRAITLNIANRTFTSKTDGDGLVIFDLSSIYPDAYIAELRFAGDDLYMNSSLSVEVTINKLAIDLTAEFKDKSLVIALEHDGTPVASMDISVELNGNEAINLSSDRKGMAILDLSGLEASNYTAVINAMGSDIFKPAGTELNFEIEPEEIVPSKATRTAEDLQKLIDNAKSGDIVDLGDFEYVNVSGINVSKDISLVGNNTTISTAGDGNPVFKIAEGLSDVEISGIEFNVNNGDLIVRAIAQNGSDPLSIKVPAIRISGNEFIGDDIAAESVTVLELDSERGILAPDNEISIVNNTLESGMKSFEFKVNSVENDSEANVPIGGNLASRKGTIIHYEDMVTAAVNSKVEGRTGKYFVVNLTDDAGNPLADRMVQIGFNGRIYNKTTDENGSAKLQINLAYAGTYTFAVSYLGDSEYNASFVVAKIKVNVQKTKIATSSKTYKASAKTKSLTATLKDSKGNAISGKTLKFTVNGKTYSAKTNAKGVATVKLSISAKKTYSFTVKYAGDYTYAASSANSKLVIK